VLPAVELKGEMKRGTIEVEDVGTNRMLSAKIQSLKLITSQGVPKLPFGLRQVLT
jgi:hypothetical protein